MKPKNKTALSGLYVTDSLDRFPHPTAQLLFSCFRSACSRLPEAMVLWQSDCVLDRA